MRGDYELRPKDTGSFYWLVAFHCHYTDGVVGYFDINTKTEVLVGDSAAATMGKIVDSVVAAVQTRGDSIARTNVHLLTFTRGS